MTIEHAIQVFAFVILTLMTLGGGFAVVTSRNLFHAALFLILSLAGVVGYYVLLDAGFLAVVQLLIYIGAISILILFSIMLTRALMMPGQVQRNEQWWIAALVVFLTFLVLVVMLWQTIWPIASEEALRTPNVAIGQLGAALVGPYAIPFEIISVLLLVALVGAIVLAREMENHSAAVETETGE
ncbi:MAG: NADH-quinone oxidoreductase subunit J family protein [Anaerolineae bacterium]